MWHFFFKSGFVISRLHSLMNMRNVLVMKVLEMESIFASPAYCREDLASLLKSVQVQEKEKLNLVCNPLSHWLLLFYLGNLGIFLIYSYV